MSIIDRIKKLLSLAKDSGAADGEITAAMRAATALIEKYQIDASELAEEKPTFHRIKSITHNNSLWEATLATAVANLFGTVGAYAGQTKVRIGGKVFGEIFFFGETKDCILAREIFEEFSEAITRNAYIRYKTLLKGDGLLYAMGFANALWELSRESTIAKQSVKVGDTSLAVRNSIVLQSAIDWLKETYKISLVAKQTTRVVNRNSGAYADGWNDGQASDFSKNRQKKLGCS